VELVAVVDLFTRIEMEPPLTAVPGGSGFPGNPEGLEPAATEGDQVLLKGLDPERVGDLGIGQPAAGTVGADEELAIPPEERRGHTRIPEGGIIEVAEDGRGGRRLHGTVMIGPPPRLGLRRMTSGALRRADEVEGLGASILAARTGAEDQKERGGKPGGHCPKRRPIAPHQPAR
jgi:hypothetical protein